MDHHTQQVVCKIVYKSFKTRIGILDILIISNRICAIILSKTKGTVINSESVNFRTI